MSRLPARFAVLALLVMGASSVRAEGPEAPSANELWIHDLRDLTYGRVRFPGEEGLFWTPDSVNDEERPLFGGEPEEELIKPFGSAVDIVEELKSEVGGWEGEGVDVHPIGEGGIFVRGPRALQEKIAEALRWRREADLSTVFVDVAFLEGDPVLAPGSDSLAAAVADGRLRLIGATRLIGLTDSQSAAFVGRESAFVEDHDVEVASGAATHDPIVMIHPEGVRVVVGVRALVPEPLVEIDAWTASVRDVRRVRSGRGEPMEFGTTDAATVQATVRLPPGRWTPVPMSRGRFLALRTVIEAPPRSKPSGPLAAVLPAEAPAGPMSPATFDLHDLAAKPPSFRGPEMWLSPSNYTPPVPPELPEPCPAVPVETVLDLAKALDPGAWALEGAEIKARHEFLLVRHDEAHWKAVADLVEGLRSRTVGSMRPSATVVRLPLASIPEFLRGGTPGDVSGLLSRPGAEVLDRIAVRVPRAGGRRADWHGRGHSYLADLDVEIAEGAVIGNPIVKRVLEGVVLDAEAYPACGGAAVACQIRFDRSVWEGVRTVPTEHGPIECPDLGLLRIRGGIVVPVGATRLVGVGIDGDRATLVLLTATVGD